MPKKSKAESYIGFCIKAGKLTCGFNAVELLKKDVFLLLLCDTVSDNGKKARKNYSVASAAKCFFSAAKRWKRRRVRPVASSPR